MLSIIGCGNLVRSDDGVGVHVIQQIERRLPRSASKVRLFDAGTAGIDVMFQARGSVGLVLIDACRTGSQPGTLFVASGQELENTSEPSFNLHDFRWDHALYAGRRIFKEDFPTDITVYLVEAKDLSFGMELTKPVKETAERVVDMLMQRIC